MGGIPPPFTDKICKVVFEGLPRGGLNFLVKMLNLRIGGGEGLNLSQTFVKTDQTLHTKQGIRGENNGEN